MKNPFVRRPVTSAPPPEFCELVNLEQAGNTLILTFRRGDRVLTLRTYATWNSDIEKLRGMINE